MLTFANEKTKTIIIPLPLSGNFIHLQKKMGRLLIDKMSCPPLLPFENHPNYKTGKIQTKVKSDHIIVRTGD